VDVLVPQNFMVCPPKRLLTTLIKRLSLRTVLSLLFVVQTVAVVGLVGTLSYINGQRAVDNLAQQLMTEVQGRVQQHLHNYTQLPQQIVELVANDIELGLIDLSQSNLQPLDPYFLTRAQAFPEVSFIYVGDQQGQFIGAGAMGQQPSSYLVEVTDQTTAQQYVSYQIDAAGQRIHQINAVPNYDPRQRPWYQAAMAAGKATWSRIYPFIGEANEGLTITAVQPFRSPQGLRGVAAVDLYLNDIDQFLKQLQVMKSGQIFILEPDGTLVASASPEPTYVKQQGVIQRVLARNSANPLVRSTITYLQQQGHLSQFRSPQSFQFHFQGQRHFGEITPWKDRHGLDWLIVAVVPEHDFMTQIYANTRTTLWLCGTATLLALLCGIGTARWVVTPIRRINRAAKDIAQGHWDRSIACDRSDEVGELADSFNQMAIQMQHSFNALRQGKAQLDTFLEAVPIGICVVEPDGNISYMNQTAQTLLGQPFSPHQPIHIRTALHHAYIAKTDRPYPLERLPMLRALQGERITIDDLEIHQVDRVIPLEVRATPIFHEAQGQAQSSISVELPVVSYAIVALQDIHGRKQAEAVLADYNRTLEAQIAERTAALTHANLALEQAKQAAETANHAKSAFLANMSHELRTPLNAILGFAQIMCMDPQTTPEQQRNLQIINRSGEHLLSLINNVLDLSKIEAGRVDVVKTCFNLAELLEVVESILRQRAESKGLQFQVTIAANVPRQISSDANKLRQTLINLVGNATKFTERGQVILRVTTQTLHPEMLKSKEAGNGLGELNQLLIFEVEDTGVGIPPEELHHIFQAFEQSSTGRLKTEGTGLGLTISHKFVELMGGTLLVRSSVGKGSTFTIHLPIAVDPCSISRTPAVERDSIVSLSLDQPRHRILIVDDEADNRELLVRMLMGLPLETRTVANGREAITLWQQWQPQLILLDLFMPGTDGFMIARKIRNHELSEPHLYPPTKIVALSASVLEADRDRAMAAGCDGFLGKPFQANNLYLVIAEQLQMRYSYTEAKSLGSLPSSSTSARSRTKPELKYLCAPHESPVPHPIQPSLLSPSLLDLMGQDWCDQLYRAALRCRDEQVLEMLAHIPPNYQDLKQQLRHYAQKFQFEMILSLLRGYSKEHLE
jgi:signal transduction histidine kinase/DNA-binding NarL/FixJ family response regulator